MKRSIHSIFLFQILFPALGGVLFVSGFISTILPSIYFGAIFGLTLFFLSLSPFKNKYQPLKNSLWLELVSLLFFSAGVTCSGFYWLPYTISEFGGILPPWNYLIALSYSIIAFPGYFVFILIYRLAHKINIPFYFLYNTKTKIHFWIAFAISLCEYFIPQQFPLFLGASHLHFAPFLGLSSTLGLIAFSFFSYWAAATLATFIRTFEVDRWAILFIGIFAATNYLDPLTFRPDDDPDTRSNHIRLVQANIGNFIKAESEKGSGTALQTVYDTYSRLAKKTSKNQLDLIILPETALPDVLTSSDQALNQTRLPPLITEISREHGAEVFFGAYDYLRTKERQNNFFETQYNTAFFTSFDTNQEVVLAGLYHKIKLLPFGETLPFGPLNALLADSAGNISFFASGTTLKLFTTKNNTLFTSAICYEILFPEFIRANLNLFSKQPHFLINLTNDSWFGNTSEPYQHLFLAKWRAMELNIPIVRMTNTGITSVIYPDGSESSRIGINYEGVLDIKLRTPHRMATTFQKWGIIPWLVMSGIILMLILAFNLPSKKVQP